MFDVETYAIIKKRIASGIGGSTSGSTINDAEISEDTMLSSQKIVDTVCPPFSVSGPIVQCTPVENYELGVKVDITPVQEGEGDPSPENVRPIVGWDAVNVTRCGKNLFDISTISTNSEIKNSGDSLTVNTALSSVRCPTKESFHKICHGAPSNIEYNFNAIITSDLKQVYFNSGDLWSFATSKNVDDSMQQSPIYFYGNTINESGIISNIQLELGSISTSYEPYRGQTHTVQLGQTVYGGTVSINNGVAQTNYTVVEFDGSDDENWRKLQHESGKIYYRTKVLKNVINANDPSKWMCNRLQPHQFNYADINYPAFSIGFQSDRISVCIVLENESTLSVEEFKVWLGENPVQFVYDSDLVDLNFDPKTITSISGTNTLYADAGNITVTGVSDPGPLLLHYKTG